MPVVPALLHPQSSHLFADATEEDDQHHYRGGLISISFHQHDILRSLIAQAKAGQRTPLSIYIPDPAALSAPITVSPVRLTARRSLTTGSMAVARMDSMVVETAPNSPPELSYSKSSKSSSSSLRSSILSEQGETEKLSHFEDITLEGRDSVDSNVKPEHRPVLTRPATQSNPNLTKMPKRTGAPPPIVRDFSNGARRGYPSLKVAVNGVPQDQSRNLPSARSMRRGINSPSSPSIFHYHQSQRVPSRSPSPSKSYEQGGYTASSPSVGIRTPRADTDQRPLTNAPLGRRQSWQPGRKSLKELEAEYDDKDDELPEDVVLENVPISPLPLQHRSSTLSPQCRPSHAQQGALVAQKRVQNINTAPSVYHSANWSPRSPRAGRRPHMVSRSATMPTFHHDPLSHRPRTKFWTEDLSQEARELSAALEEFAERASADKPYSNSDSATSSPPRPSFSKLRSKSNIVELPPIQKQNIMIDPLPISKEKEAVLTRTRPSWLPPKCQKEERKHMKEWERMMAKAAEAEKRRAAKQLTEMESKNEMQGSIARIWDQHVLPNWTTVINEPRTRELWWRGVTPGSRGPVWQRAIGNELDVSTTSFEAAFQRAKMLEDKIAEMSNEERSKSTEAAWLDAISRDVPTVFPETGAFQHGAQLYEALTNVLSAYAMYRSDVGYVYGTHLIAGLLVLNMPPAEAFVSLANMLNRPLPLAFLVHDTGAMARSYGLVLSTLKYKFTKLHDHLTSSTIGLKPEEYLDPIFRTLFARNLGIEHVSRIWDIFVLEGDKALIRAAVAVLGKLEGKLYGSREEVLQVLGWQAERRWDVGNEENFVKGIRAAGKVDGKGHEVTSAQ